MAKICLLCVVILTSLGLFISKTAVAQTFLTVNGTYFMLNGEKVFLSGMNQAWYIYAGDFGNTSYTTSKPHLIKTLDILKANGGNSISMCRPNIN